MAHKKKGSKKGISAGNGASKPQAAAAQANGEPHSYKDAVTTNLDINGSGAAEEANVHNTPDEPSPQPSPRNDTGAADKEVPKSDSKAAELPKPKSVQPQAGEQAAQDARKALEQTVENLRGDLRTEKSRREKAEQSILTWQAASAGLGLTTLAFAALALITFSRCRS
ncbi:g2210 [Coccomyxa elongata]